jgi:antitoxin component YwqK of YwqJK toxin-antitoxin module
MKKIFLTTLIFSVVSCSVSEVPIDSLVERNGIVYQVNSDKPYSGKAIEYYDNGQAEFIETYKKGRIVQTEYYSSNGALQTKSFYKDDEQTGVEEYYENGQLAYKASFDENDTGLEEEYYENGQLEYKATYKNGNLIQEEEYYKNGKKIDESNY